MSAGRRGTGGGGARDAWGGLAIAAAVGLAAGCGDGGSADYAWLQLGPDGEQIARLVTHATSCPPIRIDGRDEAMQVRAEPEPPSFPVLTCEALVPSAARQVEIGAFSLPLPRETTERLAVIGDTGCRIEDGHQTQACNDPDAWPFAGLARTVAELVAWLTGEPQQGDFGDLAQSIAAFDPDLIVHVGDYLYREDACPAGDAGCAGSPYGYDWATIEADYFAPAAPLFDTAPLALTRGNHESCSRAGEVWFRFLDPRPYTAECSNYTEPYAIELGDLQLLMLDSSAANDTSVDPAQVAIYRQQFERIADLAGPRAFLVTHRPMWVFGHAGEQDGQEVLFRSNPTLQAASESQLPPGVELVLSGHVHLFELLGFDADRPPQLVVGNSGTELDPAVTTRLAGLEIAGATVAVGETLDEFGFATLEADGPGWGLTLRDLTGSVLRTCGFSGPDVLCPSPIQRR